MSTATEARAGKGITMSETDATYATMLAPAGYLIRGAGQLQMHRIAWASGFCGRLRCLKGTQVFRVEF